MSIMTQADWPMQRKSYVLVSLENTTSVILAKTGGYSPPPKKRLQYIIEANK